MISLDLKKGMSLDLTKHDSTLTKMNLGLGWDTHMDLDSIAFLLDEHDRLVETVCYYHKNGHGVRLNGDNRTGEGDGDDEVIFVDLNRVPSNVAKIALYANIYNAGGGFFSKGKTFGQVKGAYVRLVNEVTGKEVCKYSLTEDGKNFNAFHFADLVKVNGAWTFVAIGEGANGEIKELEKRYR